MRPKARTVKFYSTVSDRAEVVHLISRLFGGDGGPGSGNHGHAGRPGQVGGSSPKGGSSQKGNKSSSNNSISGKEKADSFRALSKEEKRSAVYSFVGPEIDKMSEEEREQTFEHFAEIFESNGDPSKTSKKKYYVMRRNDPITDYINNDVFSRDEAKQIESVLRQFTSADYKNADRETLEKYISSCPVAFSGRLVRGIHVKKDVLEKLLNEAKTGTLQFDNVSSWSNDYDTGEAFAMSDDDNNLIPDDEIPVMFDIPEGYSRTPAPIHVFSEYREKEAIASKNASWTVVAIKKSKFYRDMYKNVREGYTIVLMERGEEYDRPS